MIAPKIRRSKSWLILLSSFEPISAPISPNGTNHTIILEFHLHLDFRYPKEEQHETRVAITMELAQLDSWVRQLKKYAEEFPVRYVFEML